MVVGTGSFRRRSTTSPRTRVDLNYTTNVCVERDVNAFSATAFGFGGHNTTLPIKRFKI